MKIAGYRPKRQKIPQKFLELILAGLKQGGFVESRRGAEGGYLGWRRRNRSRSARSCAYVEGRSNRKSAASRKADTPFSDLWEQVDQAVSDIIDDHVRRPAARLGGETKSSSS